jgi:hypothetical protein
MNQSLLRPRRANVVSGVHENGFLAGDLGVIEGFVGGLRCPAVSRHADELVVTCCADQY